MGNTDILALNPRLRIYHGKINDSWQTRKKFLDGQEAYKWGNAIKLEPDQIDITRLSAEELIKFASEHYAVELKEDTDYAHALVAVVKARQASEQAAAEAKQKHTSALKPVRPTQAAGIQM
jgi:hypothetical protein